MSKVYCVSDHSPEELVRWLSTVKDVSPTSITIHPTGERLELARPKKYKKLILLLSYTDFIRNLKTVNANDFRHKEFYVLLPVSRFVEFENVQPLDFEFSDDSSLAWNLMELQEEFLDYTPLGPVSKCRENFKDVVVNKVKSINSILAPLMTIVYSAGKTVQKPLTYELCSYLYYGKDMDSDLDDLISKLQVELQITGRGRINRITHLLTSPLSEQVKVACTLIREAIDKGNSPDYDNISNVSGVHSYDLNYISNVIDNADDYAVGTGITVRDFQKNQLAKKKRTKLKEKLKGKK